MARDTRSPSEIERDLESTRLHLERTLDALQSRLQPGALFEQSLNYVRSDGRAFGRNMVESVRDNPIPVTLLTIGLGWLMISGRREHEHALYEPEETYVETYPEMFEGAEETRESTYDPFALSRHPSASEQRSLGARARKGAGAAMEGARGVGHRAASAARAAKHGTTGAARTAGQGAGATARSAGSAVAGLGSAAGSAVSGIGGAAGSAASGLGRSLRGAGQGGRAVGRTFGRLYEDYPLAVGAMAVGAGALLATMLPRTRTEEEALRPLREEAVERGRARTEQVADQTAVRARAALRAATHPTEAGESSESETESGATERPGPEAKSVPEPERGQPGGSRSGSRGGSAAGKTPPPAGQP